MGGGPAWPKVWPVGARASGHKVETENIEPDELKRILSHAMMQVRGTSNPDRKTISHRNFVGIYLLSTVGMRMGSLLSIRLSDIEEAEQPTPTSIFEKSIEHLEADGALIYFERGLFANVFGTDEIGQDIFSRVIYGMRLSLFLALTVTLVSVIIGTSYGAVAGYSGGWVDTLMMRFVDFLFGVPFIFLVILLMVFFGRHIFLIFVGLGLVYWIVLARIVRGQILSVKEREFVLAARSNGVSQFAIIFKHLIPNVMGPVVVFSTLLVPQIMLLEAFLSFIGLGVSPPDVSLGILISDGASVISSFTWPILYPGIIFSIMIFVLSIVR